MNRKYQRDLFTQKVSLIKKYMPLAAIGADVIVGFPGETEADFEDTYQFIERVDLSFLHVFSYSERKKTRAAGFENKVSKQQKDIRSKKLHILANDKKEKFYYANIGQTHQVLFEAAENKGKISGFTGNYIRVETDFEEQLIKSIKECTIKNLLPNGNMSVSF